MTLTGIYPPLQPCIAVVTLYVWLLPFVHGWHFHYPCPCVCMHVCCLCRCINMCLYFHWTPCQYHQMPMTRQMCGFGRFWQVFCTGLHNSFCSESCDEPIICDTTEISVLLPHNMDVNVPVATFSLWSKGSHTVWTVFFPHCNVTVERSEWIFPLTLI